MFLFLSVKKDFPNSSDISKIENLKLSSKTPIKEQPFKLPHEFKCKSKMDLPITSSDNIFPPRETADSLFDRVINQISK